MLARLQELYHELVPEDVRRTHRYRWARQFFWNLRLRRKFGVDSTKHATEARYWEARFREEGGVLQNGWYRDYMLNLARESDHEFVRDRIIADFGCGPRGSLCWAKEARVRIGIDVLVDIYSQFGIAEHDMTYVRSSEATIPLPSAYVDVLFTLNAMDHVDDFERMCTEVLRVLAPGGALIASFNLNEPRTFSEPQTLNLERIRACLLDHLEIVHERIAPRAPGKDQTRWVAGREDGPELRSGEPGFLWVRARKRGGADGRSPSGSVYSRTDAPSAMRDARTPSKYVG